MKWMRTPTKKRPPTSPNDVAMNQDETADHSAADDHNEKLQGLVGRGLSTAHHWTLSTPGIGINVDDRWYTNSSTPYLRRALLHIMCAQMP